MKLADRSPEVRVHERSWKQRTLQAGSTPELGSLWADSLGRAPVGSSLASALELGSENPPRDKPQGHSSEGIEGEREASFQKPSQGQGGSDKVAP